MKRLLQINPVVRTSTSTGRIMQEIGELAMDNGWESHIAYSYGRDGIKPCASKLVPVGNKLSVAVHGVATRLFDRHGLASNLATRAFVERLSKLKPDVIHLHNIHGYFLNYKILFDYLERSGIPVIWTIHDSWIYTGHCYYYSFVGCNRWQTGCGLCPQKKAFPASFVFDRSRRNYVDKQAAFTSIPQEMLIIVPVSQWIKRELQYSFLRNYDMRVIRNGINTDVFDLCDATSVRHKYHLGNKRIFLGVASIWSQEKGLYDFFRLSDMLNEEEVIVLVGVDAHLLKRLPRKIVGITRTQDVHQLAELYSAATALINPTWQDNYPTVNLEAIACGTPVVTYRTGGSIEAVTDATGMIVEQGDVEGLLRAVRTIAAKGKGAYRDACRHYALKNFRKQDRYAEYIDLYNSLAQKSM